MAKATTTVKSYQDIPVDRRQEVIAWVDSDSGGFRFKRDPSRSKTWHFGCRLTAWQVGDGPVVHEKVFVRKERLNDADSLKLIRQTPKGRLIQFQARLPKDASSLQKSQWYWRLDGPICKPGRAAAKRMKEFGLQKPESRILNDRVFGQLKCEADQEEFQGTVSYCGEELNVSFLAETSEQLASLLDYAKPLWKLRDTWFRHWQLALFSYYQAHLQENWWESEEKLTKAVFRQHLGWPVGMEFLNVEGVSSYRLTGWSEELFSDHGIDAFGTSINEMEFQF